MARPWLLLVSSLPLLANAADEGRVSFLEQEVRNLQRQVMALSRRVEELERPNALAAGGSTRPASPSPAPSSDSWIDAGKWRKVRPGMSELEVITLLGPPTSMRNEDDARILFYAMEVGSAGFLGGSVKFRGRIVSEIRVPTLQ
jgi:hypothetical protein